MDDISKVFGAIISLVLVVSFLSVMGNMFTAMGEQKCQPYKDEIIQKDTEITGLNAQNEELRKQLRQCQESYEKLVEENITKKDIEEIKGYYNITQYQISNLNQRIEQQNTNYVNFYNVLLNNYRLSLTINLAIGFTLLGIEILSFVFLKSEFVMFVVNAILKYRRRKKDD
jgi:septal ring factor EnvC (AmiA/AmiB activator)